MTYYYYYNPKFYQIGAGNGGGSWSPSYDAWKITLPHLEKINKETEKLAKKTRTIKSKVLEINTRYGDSFPDGMLKNLETLQDIDNTFKYLSNYAVVEVSKILKAPEVLAELISLQIPNFTIPEGMLPLDVMTIVPLLKASPSIERVTNLGELANLLRDASEEDRKRTLLYHIMDEDIVIYCVLMDG